MILLPQLSSVPLKKMLPRISFQEENFREVCYPIELNTNKYVHSGTRTMLLWKHMY